MKKRNIIILSAVAVVAIVLIIIFASGNKDGYVPQVVKAQKGLFEIIVTTTGELEAESNIKIEGPSGMTARNVRLGEVKIQDLVPEGTVVKQGDYVAMLDRTSADNSLKDLEDEHEALIAKYDRTLLDTSLSLKALRDDIENQKFTIEEAEIAVEQSIYEPPATQRQYRNNLEKALRSYEQALNNYDLKVEQAQATVNDVAIELNRKKRQLDELRAVLKDFTIYAPSDGMVIYYRDWSGDKRRIGSTISGWDLVVATLPDLSNMLSKTYVNEIDIAKVRPGQMVRIGVDAFPEKSYTGIVKEVSNIGEQLRNADAKVFEVIIKVDGQDEILRPAMTTSNQIITASIDSAVFLPSEAIFERDSITYIYRTNGIRQIVVKGESNDNFTVIEQGLAPGDEVYLSLPQNPSRFKVQGEEYISVIKQRIIDKAEAEKRKAEEQESLKQRRMIFPGGQGPQNMELPQGVTLPGGAATPEGTTPSRRGVRRVERLSGTQQ
ncbi:MAG TPA: efflux RND transporter periplasmic adaptor subunit [Bacteroidales bacterium]|nr:MAG: Macrolide export protein MacA [Bacteroidetes bacterium ADurb.Bin139]HOG26145.1 efflux RND transporter periplasmic adaptor subunit [Bacteroidales bacterium]HOR12147.1 efflux RND transporter periplasmic adaptor subunit [Bacteroidales bacterium]HOZ20018.1 efflux RND transporter periplasmic adaptor subunit [Bacteroidales bacterium]HPB78470.1 efflux RND transporter periplasmic adaptor subunit [Bacteroidales bacterium]